MKKIAILVFFTVGFFVHVWACTGLCRISNQYTTIDSSLLPGNQSRTSPHVDKKSYRKKTKIAIFFISNNFYLPHKRVRIRLLVATHIGNHNVQRMLTTFI